MTGHGITSESIEFEVGYSCVESPPLEVVAMLLVFPSGLAAPFGDQPFATGFNERERLVVGGFQEEGHAEDRKFNGARCCGVWTLEYGIDRTANGRE